jgi:F0F1-type ATP synthase membrane subunit b/b'
MIAAAFLFIWNTLKAFWEILKESPIARYLTFGVAVAILISLFFLCRGCQSATEKRIESRDPVIVEQEQAANHAVDEATNANVNATKAQTNANRAQAEVNRIRRDKRSNVSVEEANRNRCLVFPESPECVR